MIDTLLFDSNIVSSEKINNLFTKVKIHVAYDGINRNSSFISKDTFNKAAQTAKYCPIVGEWSNEANDFQGHGGKIEIKDGNVDYIRTTVAYGCIGDEEPYWETVTSLDGTSTDYFTLTGYLWTDRFPELMSLVEQGQKNHSMEVSINDGQFVDQDGQKVYSIDDMTFSGFCILGNQTEPCFEQSTISVYSLDKDEFKRQFNEMIAELKTSLSTEFNISNTEEGGNEVEENKEFEVKEVVEPAEEEFKAKKSEEESEPVDNADEEKTEEMAKNEQPVVDPDNDGDNDADPDENDDVDEDNKDPKAYELDKAEFESKISELEKQLGELQVKFNKLEEEANGLREFKLNVEKVEKESAIVEVFASVEGALTEDELAPLKEKAFEMDIEELKTKVFALIGQKSFSKNKKSNEKGKVSMGIYEFSKNDKSSEQPYSHIITKFVKK